MSVNALFAYGTLMVPSVMLEVTGRTLSGEPARLQAHARYRMRGAVYPGIVEEAGAVTDGLLFRDLDAITWQRLDEFEDRIYDRVIVSCALPASGRIESAYVYRVRQRGVLSAEPWSLDTFVAQHLDEYLR